MKKLIPLITLTFLLGVETVVAQPITSAADGTGTNITSPNNNPNQFDIDGGTRTGNNLFHSFEKFGLSQGQIANFLANPDIQNILGRVTGGNQSTIDGLLKMTGGDANLFLMNPAGIIFGSNATLDLPGSFTATTANGIRLGDSWFKAVGSNDYSSLGGEPTGFAFATDETGIIVNEGELAVGSGNAITLVGGLVINTGTLTSPEGDITIAAVPGQQLVEISQEGSLVSIALPVATEEVFAGDELVTAVALPELLTGGEVELATSMLVEEDGTVRLTGSEREIAQEPGVVVASGTIDSENLTISNGGNINLSAENNSNLSPGGTITITSSGIFSNEVNIEGWDIVINDSSNINNDDTDVRLKAPNNIIFNDPVTIDTPGIGLMATAGNMIIVNSPISTSSGGTGAINLQATGNIILDASDVTLMNPDGSVTLIDAGGAVKLESTDGNITLGSANRPVVINSSSIVGGDNPGEVKIIARNGMVELFGIIQSGQANKNPDSTILIDAGRFIARNPITLSLDDGGVINDGIVGENEIEANLLAFPAGVPEGNNPEEAPDIEIDIATVEFLSPIVSNNQPMVIRRGEVNDNQDRSPLIRIKLRQDTNFVVGETALDSNTSGLEGEIVIGEFGTPPEVGVIVGNSSFGGGGFVIPIDQVLAENEGIGEEETISVAFVCDTDFTIASIPQTNLVQATCEGQLVSFAFPTPKDAAGNPLPITPELFPQLLTGEE